MKRTSARCLAGACTLAAWFLLQHVAEAKVALPAVFSNNMVLQRNDNVQFYGTAAAGSKLTVTPSWNNKQYTTRVGNDGNWQLAVPTPAAGKGFRISFNDGEELLLQNVQVGDVWFCSGQSNMEMPLNGLYGGVLHAQQEVAAANHPEIRFLQVAKVSSNTPLTEARISGGGWEVCAPETAGRFSAIAYFFARDLQQSQSIPIGIISSSYGGTVAEAWTSASGLKTMPDFRAQVAQLEQHAAHPKSKKQLLETYEQEQAAFKKLVSSKDAGLENARATWAADNMNTANWQTMVLPALWETKALPGFDGIVWFRKNISIPAAWAGEALELNLGPIDDDEITFFNGEQVGQTEGYDKLRTYKVPARLVRAGENTITVRVADYSGYGGMYGRPGQLFLANAAGERIVLAGEWLFKPAADLKALPPGPQYPIGPNRASVLYNAMVHPFTKLPIKGVIWYQGESNAARAAQYRTLFPLLISDWRRNWGRGDFPFYFVQLANYMAPTSEPGESDWAELREAQLLALQAPNTGMAVTIDIGEEKNIHPKNKQEVGRRLALLARANTYREKIAFSGPLYKRMQAEGNTIRISFDHATTGLKTKNGEALTGFAIAGADRKFHWAEATIVGNEVLVSSRQVPKPVAVRYGWAHNPAANLYNSQELPASPFRTDNWPGVTGEK